MQLAPPVLPITVAVSTPPALDARGSKVEQPVAREPGVAQHKKKRREEARRGRHGRGDGSGLSEAFTEVPSAT